MTEAAADRAEEFARSVRIYVFRQAAETGHVPQPPRIAEALQQPQAEVEEALRYLAAGKVLILAPNGTNIWAANPFCAVPSGFRVDAVGKTYQAICVWDALGIAAALGSDALVRTSCGDCGDPMMLGIQDGELTQTDGIVHFAVPAHHWWDNIGFT
ncbi:hypothetical protein BH24ACI4_BH24ACI4_29250 [soil metagenome]